MPENNTPQPTTTQVVYDPPPFIQQLLTPQNLLLLGAVGFLCLYQLFKPAPKGKGARWATQKERSRARRTAMKQTRNRYKKPNVVGVVLDNDEREGFPNCQLSTMFCGAPGTGKSWYGMNPKLKAHLDRGDTLVLYDYKYPDQTELIVPYAIEAGYRKEDIHIFAPSFPESCVFNVVDAATPEYAPTLAETFVKNFTKTDDRDPFFGPAGIALTTADLMLAHEIGGDITTCQAVLSRDRLPSRIRAAQEHMNPWTYAAFSQFLSSAGSQEGDSRTASSISGTAALNFEKFMKPHLISAVTGKSTLPLILEGKKLVVVGCNYNYRQATLPILAVVLQLLIDSNVFPGRTSAMLISLDEFPTVYLPSLVGQINELRSYGVFFDLGLQNIAQLEMAYGREKAKPILGAARNKVIYNPTDYESAEYFSKMLGQRQLVERDSSRSYGGGKITRNKSFKREWRPLCEPGEILSLDEGYRIVLSSGVGCKGKKFIPYITNAAPNQECIDAFARAKDAWPELRKEFALRSTQKRVTPQEIDREILKIETLLPIPEPKRETAEDIANDIFGSPEENEDSTAEMEEVVSGTF